MVVAVAAILVRHDRIHRRLHLACVSPSAGSAAIALTAMLPSAIARHQLVSPRIVHCGPWTADLILCTCLLRPPRLQPCPPRPPVFGLATASSVAIALGPPRSSSSRSFATSHSSRSSRPSTDAPSSAASATVVALFRLSWRPCPPQPPRVPPSSIAVCIAVVRRSKGERNRWERWWA